MKYGRPGIDYPNFHDIPATNFSCREQRYKGFFGDPETKCQVWHYCDLNGGKASFLCPNGTIFSQATLTCDWWVLIAQKLNCRRVSYSLITIHAQVVQRQVCFNRSALCAQRASLQVHSALQAEVSWRLQWTSGRQVSSRCCWACELFSSSSIEELEIQY